MIKNPYWSEEVEAQETYLTPDGTFTKSALEIVEVLMKGAHNDATLALWRLMFYMNRAGRHLTNTTALQEAKAQLKKMKKTK